jgi:1-acyl-sn-glycerol-3-phosphate acyltransferase
MLSPPPTEQLAIVVWAGIALAIAAWGIALYRRSPYTPAQVPLYILCHVMTRILWRARVVGQVPFAAGEGAVIVCNHIGPIDPAFIALACNRPVHWMVAGEYFKIPVIGHGLHALGCIPTNRGGVDIRSTKMAVRLAQAGDLVGLFPEGRINESSRFLLPGRPGAALIALKAQVPVVPCYIQGSPYDGTIFGFFFIAAKTTLVVGQPIDLSDYYHREGGEREILDALTKRFLKEIATLAGRADYAPDLAGRKWKQETANMA